MPTESDSTRPELPPDAGVQDIQSDIERTRQELGETVNALAAKTDVAGRVKGKFSDNPPVGALIAAVGIAVIGLLWWRRRHR